MQLWCDGLYGTGESSKNGRGGTQTMKIQKMTVPKGNELVKKGKKRTGTRHSKQEACK